MMQFLKKINLDKYENIIFVLTFLSLLYSIISNSFFDSFGFLSTDSTHFLKLAQSLKEDNGFYVFSWTNSGTKNFFSMWPIGYPFLIYSISEILNIGVFWSSKFANVVCILSILFLLKKNIRSGFSFATLILLSGSFINIFSYTYTENLFALGLILYVFNTSELETNPTKRNLLSSILAFIIVFSSRYIGGFLILYNVLMIFNSIKKGKSIKYLTILLICSSTYVLIYLYTNKYLTGHFTYPHAYLTYETWYEITLHFIKKILEELNLIMASVRFNSYPLMAIFSSLISAIFFYYVSIYLNKNKVINQRLSGLAKKFFILGGMYIGIVIIWRITIWFSPFSYRILFPSTILLLLGLIFKILSKTKSFNSDFKRLYLVLFIISSISFSFNVLYKQHKFKGMTYNQNINIILDKYKKVEKGSYLIFGERQLDYLRTDIVPLKPYYLPLFSKAETINEFNYRIRDLGPIYFNIPSLCTKPYSTISGDRDLNCISLNHKIHHFDKDIISYIKKNNKIKLFRVKNIK